jgi:hypothetical protein
MSLSDVSAARLTGARKVDIACYEIGRSCGWYLSGSLILGFRTFGFEDGGRAVKQPG